MASGWGGGAGGIPPSGAIPASKMNPSMKPGMRPFRTNTGQTGYYQIPMPSPWAGAGGAGAAGQAAMPISNSYGASGGLPQGQPPGMMGGGSGIPMQYASGMGGMMGSPQMGPMPGPPGGGQAQMGPGPAYR